MAQSQLDEPVMNSAIGPIAPQPLPFQRGEEHLYRVFGRNTTGGVADEVATETDMTDHDRSFHGPIYQIQRET